MKNPAKVLHKTLTELGGRRERTPKSRRDMAGASIYSFADGWQVLIRQGITADYAHDIISTAHDHFGLPRPERPAPKERPVRKSPPRPTIGPKSQISLSPHAAERFRLMRSQAKVTQFELARCLLEPEEVVYSPVHDSWGYTGPRLKVDVAVSGGRVVIKTIEWSREELWQLYPRPKKAVA